MEVGATSFYIHCNVLTCLNMQTTYSYFINNQSSLQPEIVDGMECSHSLLIMFMLTSRLAWVWLRL